MQTDNRFFDSLARLFTDAAGAAQTLRAEVETMVKSKMERLVSELDFVTCEEFDAVKAMAAKARSENLKLAARVAVLEAAAGSARAPGKKLAARARTREPTASKASIKAPMKRKRKL